MKNNSLEKFRESQKAFSSLNNWWEGYNGVSGLKMKRRFNQEAYPKTNQIDAD